MEGDMGHMDGLINPRPGRGQYYAGNDYDEGKAAPQNHVPSQVPGATTFGQRLELHAWKKEPTSAPKSSKEDHLFG